MLYIMQKGGISSQQLFPKEAHSKHFSEIDVESVVNPAVH